MRLATVLTSRSLRLKKKSKRTFIQGEESIDIDDGVKAIHKIQDLSLEEMSPKIQLV